jgi:hypothetical protein
MKKKDNWAADNPHKKDYRTEIIRRTESKISTQELQTFLDNLSTRYRTCLGAERPCGQVI